MWKRTKNTGHTTNRISFSLVHQYIQRFNEVSGSKSAVIRRRSKVPGVMITQYVPNLPEGKSTPDFQCKPIPVTVKEGKSAVFKAVVNGDPKPEVSWRRAKGTVTDKDKFHSKYDESTGEYILEIRKVSAVEADTYKCYAVNEYGKAVCTATLTMIATSTNPSDFRKLLRSKKESKVEENQSQTPDQETDEKFWDAMMKAEKKDYERICAQFGVADLNSVLKKLEEKKKERAQRKSKDGIILYDEETIGKHHLKNVGNTMHFSMKGEMQKDTGISHANVGETNLLRAGLNLTDAEDIDLMPLEFKLSNVDFIIKIQEVAAEERDDALFECVLTHPLPKITWMSKGKPLEDGEKYSITVSDHKLIHGLLIKDCTMQDKGIYSAVAGITSCSAWLTVEVESDPSAAGKQKSRRTALAGGAGTDLEKVAKQQQIKNREEMEKILAAVKAKYKEEQQTGNGKLYTYRGDGETIAVTGPGVNPGADKDKLNSRKAFDLTGTKKLKNSRGFGSASTLHGSDYVMKEEEQISTKQMLCDQDDFDKVTDTNDGVHFEEDDNISGSAQKSIYINHIQEMEHGGPVFREEHANDESNQIEKYDTRQNVLGCSAENGNSSRPLTHSGHTKKVHWKNDPNEPVIYSEDDEDSIDKTKHSSHSKQRRELKNRANDPSETANYSDNDEDCTDQEQTYSTQSKKPKESVSEESSCTIEESEYDETEEETGTVLHSRRKRQGPLIEDFAIDPGVQFICGLSDVNAIIGESAELTCKLSSEDCMGTWFRDGKKISPDDNFEITKDGAIHKIIIITCKDEHSGKYRFEADGRKTEAIINVKDPPRFDPEDLSAFTNPVTVKAGHSSIFKLHFIGHMPIKVKWYRDGEELQDDNATKIEKSASHSRLLLSRCQRKDTGEIKIKLKNEDGFIEAISQLIVLDKPTPPLGPAEVTESSATCIEFKWRPPKDDGGSPVINYILERQQVGRNTWKKIGEIPGVPTYRDTDLDRGRKYCYRIRAVTVEGISEVMETEEIQAGTLAFPGPPAPPKVVSAFDDCINLSWAAPSNTGGSHILGYIVEKRKKGSNLWTVANAMDELIKAKKYAVKEVVAGMEYEFRVTAINLSGVGESSNPSEFVFARDPKKPPGKVIGLKVTETSYSHLVLTWTKPEDKPTIQDEAKGYFVEIRQAECLEWSRCNNSPIITTSFSVKGLRSMDMYWVRVIATNDGGESEAEELTNYVIAMPSPVRPKFTNNKMKSFMVVRAGNSVRITINFEASPRPQIMWLKDNVPITKRVTISNSDGSSQLFIPSSERSDSGIYSILVKNFAGQDTYSTEVRVTDDPKPPGLVELEENVPGTVTVTWEPSPDEKRDDRLHYIVSKLDLTKRTWATVAERLFNNKFTVCNIMQGRQYHFRVYAKNDMGVSAPSESPIWGTEKKKEKFLVSLPTIKDRELRCAPTFIVPLKLHTAPKGYECYMSCAVRGNPKPRITWYRNHISINTNDNYYISNTYGVCSMLILRVSPKDMGEYMITAENALGRAECATMLSVRE